MYTPVNKYPSIYFQIYLSLHVRIVFFAPVVRNYRKRRASRSHSNKHSISPSRTGPLTLRTMDRPVAPPLSSSINSTRTCVTLPVLPVRPRTRFTLANLTGWSYIIFSSSSDVWAAYIWYIGFQKKSNGQVSCIVLFRCDVISVVNQTDSTTSASDNRIDTRTMIVLLYRYAQVIVLGGGGWRRCWLLLLL